MSVKAEIDRVRFETVLRDVQSPARRDRSPASVEAIAALMRRARNPVRT